MMKFSHSFRHGCKSAARTRTERRLCVFREPFLQPVAEGHAAVFREVDALVVLNHLVQLRHQFLLRFGERAFEDGRAVVFVTDDDSLKLETVSSE